MEESLLKYEGKYDCEYRRNKAKIRDPNEHLVHMSFPIERLELHT